MHLGLSWTTGSRGRLLLIGLSALLATARSSLGGADTYSDPAAALARLQTVAEGSITLAFDGVLPLPEQITVKSNLILDATGRSVTLDAGNGGRHFVVTNGARLQLRNLTLQNGRAVANTAGGLEGAGRGGSILNFGGLVELIGCNIRTNEAAGAAGTKPSSGTIGGLQPGSTGGAAYGGAICSIGGELVISNCTFEANRATGGQGAVSNAGYTGGGGDAAGGAVYSTNSQVLLESIIFTANSAIAGEISAGRPLAGGGQASGGAIAAEAGEIKITGCIFQGDRAIGATKVGSDTTRQTGLARGGALFLNGGRAEVKTTLFQNNSGLGGIGAERGGREIVFGDGRGGAVFNRGGLSITKSAFASNRAAGSSVPADCCSPLMAQAGTGEGGALANEGLLILENSTLHGNIAAGGTSVSAGAFAGPAYGGGIVNITGTLGINNVTLAANESDTIYTNRSFGSSIAIVGGTASCTNSILACAPARTNVFGSVTDGGSNICSDDSARFSRSSSLNGTDPILGELGDYGGATLTLPLLPQSPAIDAGDFTACSSTDQRGFSRPAGAGCDIGAFELAPSLTLNYLPDRQVVLIYQFQAARATQISASTNLVDWVALETASADETGEVRITDTNPGKDRIRFYRVDPIKAEAP